MSAMLTGPAWRRLLVAAAAATVANLILLALGNAAGGSFLATVPDGSEFVIDAGPVILTTLVSLAVGGVARALLGRFSWGTRTLQAAAVVLTIASMAPIAGLDVELVTTLTLGAMHIVVGAAYLLAIAPEREPAAQAPAPERASAGMG